MKVNVVFFGRLKQDTGTRQHTLELAQDAITVADLIVVLENRYPALVAQLGTVAYAVNDELVDLDHVLRDGDEAGLLPPVSGG